MASLDTHHIFPFFDLSQELRDAIYDLLLVERVDFRRDTSTLRPKLEAKGLAATNVLLVSHQVNKEYLARAHANSHLTIFDHGKLAHCPPHDDDLGVIPTALRGVKSVMFRLQFAHPAGHDFASIERWIHAVLRYFHQLKRSEILLMIPRSSKPSFAASLLDKSAWASSDKLQRMTIWNRSRWEGGKFEVPLEEWKLIPTALCSGQVKLPRPTSLV